MADETHGNSQYSEELITKVGFLYRGGAISIAEISRQCKVPRSNIYRWAKEFGWERDLKKRVKEATQKKLNDLPEILDSEDEDEAVDKQARLGVEIIRQHRVHTKDGRDMAMTLLAELKQDTSKYVELLETIEIETAGDTNGLRRMHLERAVGLPSRSKTLLQIANALKVFMESERKSYGLDDKEDDAPYEGLLAELARLDGLQL